LVTGDNSQSALTAASAVGIAPEQVIAHALPEDKLTKVAALQGEGHCVLMMGDGVNDAAALALSDISIAIGTGTDTAISTADITLMRPQLMGAIDALNLSKKTLSTIRGNLFWAFGYNAIGLPLAVLGFASPLYAAAAMAASSLFVVTNSLRIR
jgi:Cu+-exporting ATPase